MCLTEKMCVLDKLRSGMGPSDFGHELMLVNQQYIIKQMSLNRNTEFGMDMYTVICLKWITNKVLLYSTGNSAQCYVAAWMREEFGGE